MILFTDLSPWILEICNDGICSPGSFELIEELYHRATLEKVKYQVEPKLEC